MAFKDEEIAEVIEDTKRLPSTSRRGFHSDTDDVAEGPTGDAVHVPTAGNPEDRFPK